MVSMSTAARAVLAGVGLCLLACFAALGAAVRSRPYGPDAAIVRVVAGWRSPPLTGVVRVANAVLSPALGWLVAAAVALAVTVAAVQRARRGALAGACALFAYLLVWRGVAAVKVLVDRRRPTGVVLEHATGFSYPSGHVAAVTAATAAGFAAAWWWRRGVAATTVAAVVAPLAAGFDRVYLGVHYPTDVAGSICGVWGGVLVAAAALGGALTWSGRRPPSHPRRADPARRSSSTAAPGG